MALGWLYLYSRYRKQRRRAREYEDEREAGDEICNRCGYKRRQHLEDDNESCPIF